VAGCAAEGARRPSGRPRNLQFRLSAERFLRIASFADDKSIIGEPCKSAGGIYREVLRSYDQCTVDPREIGTTANIRKCSEYRERCQHKALATWLVRSPTIGKAERLEDCGTRSRYCSRTSSASSSSTAFDYAGSTGVRDEFLLGSNRPEPPQAGKAETNTAPKAGLRDLRPSKPSNRGSDGS